METFCVIIVALLAIAATRHFSLKEGFKNGKAWQYGEILSRFRQSPKNLFEDIQYDAELPPRTPKEHITDY